MFFYTDEHISRLEEIPITKKDNRKEIRAFSVKSL